MTFRKKTPLSIEISKSNKINLVGFYVDLFASESHDKSSFYQNIGPSEQLI